MAKQQIIIAGLLLIVLCRCGNISNKDEKNQDKFYTVTGGWDWIRVPLLKPYEAKKIDPEIETSTWIIVVSDKVNLDNIGNIKKVSVVDSTIFVLSGGNGDSTYFGGKKVPIALHVLDVRNKTEKGFASEKEFKTYIKENKYPNPQWLSIDSLSEALSNKKKLPWFPI
jgi:hypothetical protein